MARSDLLLNLIKAGVKGDQAQLQKTIEALAADERAKNHGILADRLVAQIQGNGKQLSLAPTIQQDISSNFVATITPARHLEDLIFPSECEQVVRDLVEEQRRADLLRSYDLEPRNRVLLVGPPGNGKTTLAEAIANELDAPLLVVHYEAVIGSYLGETAQRIAQVFEYARSRQCVLFFDEFDVVGKERGDIHETGEIKRVVSSLLLQIDALPSYVVVVAASNHPELLDRAVWRRFQLRLELPPPKQAQIEEWFRRFEKLTGRAIGIAPRVLAQNLKGLSFAEIELFGTDVLRKIVLSEPNADSGAIARKTLNHWKRQYHRTSQEKNEEETHHAGTPSPDIP